jgi:DNA helicase II / ATP-dependent DNA helicase PcrA
LDLTKLNPAQKKAVESINGPCMIIAGAGSGKTRVLTYKIAYLIDAGVSPYNILALTFTNKAAGEMKERVYKLSSVSIDKLWIGTFHSIFARILRIEAVKIGFDRNFTIYDSEDSAGLIRRIIQNSGYPNKINPNAVHSYISNLKNKLISPVDFSETVKKDFDRIVSEIYYVYQETLSENNCMDFDDLLLKPLELFSNDIQSLEKYQHRFNYILVDEYQDTNKAQYEVIKLLAGKHKNISVVGDDAQSIYKWRGAEIKNIFDFENDFKDHKIYRLEQNYRSTANILSLADNVIKNNKKQIEKNLWTESEKGEKITLTEFLTDKDESSRIAKYITVEMRNKKLNFKDFAILYRTNAQSRLLEESLREYNIPYLIVGGIRFYQRKEIKDILCYFKSIANPRDEESLLRVINQAEGIGKTSIEKLKEISKTEGKTLFEVIQNIESYDNLSNKIRSGFAKIGLMISKYKYLKEEIPLKELTKSLIDETGILSDLKMENTFESEERISNINELVSAIASYEDNEDESSLEGFLEKVSLVADIDELDNKKNAVTLMTIHSAKGLEYPVIFITGLEEGLFPVMNAIYNEDDLEEERRLFYVAITRAQKKLYITFTNQRYKFGQQSYQLKSRFLKEISEDILDKCVLVEGLTFQSRKNYKEKESFENQERTYDKRNSYDNIKLSRKKIKEEYVDDKFPEIQKGVKIFHERFGNGTVVSTSGNGIDKKAEIYFEDIGLVKIILKYAKMRINEEL